MGIGSIALVAILALAVLVAVVMAVRMAGRTSATQPMPTGASGAASARWYEIFAAACLLLLLAAAVVVLISTQFATDGTAKAAGDWRDESGAIVFVVVMLAAAGLGLLAFALFFFARIVRRSTAPASSVTANGTADDVHPSPAGAPLIGLLGLGLSFLLLAWFYLTHDEQYALMLRLIYPAGFAVAMVLMFDKAARAWDHKSTAESVREWLLCDGITFLLFIGFLNLLRYQTTEQYASLFWDVLHIAGFMLTFWILDRARTRYRFLFAYGYLIVLPILLLVWRLMQELPTPEELSWWSTVWPFFWLAVVFLVLEIIALMASRGSENHAVPAMKDGLFVLLYAVFLLVAIPDSG